MQPRKRLRSWIHENTQPQSARNCSCQHSREAEERRKARGGRKQWRPTLGLACLVSRAAGHHIPSGFTHTSSLHCSLLRFLSFLFLRPTLPLGFDPSGPLLWVQCLSKQQQQQTAVCSAANGMQLLSKDGSNENEKHFRESSCFLICTSLSLSLSDARSRLPVKLVITHDHAPKTLLSAYA